MYNYLASRLWTDTLQQQQLGEERATVAVAALKRNSVYRSLFNAHALFQLWNCNRTNYYRGTYSVGHTVDTLFIAPLHLINAHLFTLSLFTLNSKTIL